MQTLGLIVLTFAVFWLVVPRYGMRQTPIVPVIAVNGTCAGAFDYHIAESGFTDVTQRIPGSAITEGVSRIGFMGDHIVCCYWFYQ